MSEDSTGNQKVFTENQAAEIIKAFVAGNGFHSVCKERFMGDEIECDEDYAARDAFYLKCLFWHLTHKDVLHTVEPR
mgnify:CR=1 FL=1